MKSALLPTWTLCWFLLFGACQPHVSESSTVEVRLIEVKEAGYGYEIWQQGKRLIRQESLPSLPGKVVCPDQACAERVGNAVAQQIRTGHFPPTLSREEVERLRKTP